MKFNFFLLIMIFPGISNALLNEAMLKKFNADYIKVSKLKDSTNPELKTVEELIEEKNEAFFKSLEKKVSATDLEIIKADINNTQKEDAINIEKQYLQKIQPTQEVSRLSEEQSQTLSDLVATSKMFLHKNVTLEKNPSKKQLSSALKASPASVKDKKQLSTTIPSSQQNAETEEERKIKLSQREALSFSKKKPSTFKSNEEDSLFEKVSKAYSRNLEKVISLEDN